MDRRGVQAWAPVIPDVELIEQIGTGGSGAVYRGHQPALGRDVAVKVVATPGAPEAGADRWRREVSALGRLSNHPNIVGVYAGGVTPDGSPYLVMPYVPGGSLRDRLDSEGPVPPVETAQLGAKLAGALATAHGAGVLHRDVKPENVLMSPYGEPQLSDFGIARLADSSTTVGGAVWATIAYAAPEVLDGRAASEASDVYGLGATLYACLTGAAPFVAGPDETLVSLVARVLTSDQVPLVERGVPAPLAGVVERAMAKEPSARQVSAVALRRDLEGVAQVLSRDPAAPPSPLPVAPPTAGSDPTSPGPSASSSRPAPSRTTAAGGRLTPTSARSRRGMVATAVGAVALVGLAIGVLVAPGGDGADPSVAGPPEVTSPEVPAPSVAPSTTVPPTATSSTTAPSTTEPPPPSASPAVAAPLASAALSYLDTVADEDFDQAWRLTSSRFRRVQDREGWRRFWSGIDDVEVVGEPRVDPDQATVVVPLRVDGQREDYQLAFVQEDGAWLVDGPTSRR